MLVSQRVVISEWQLPLRLTGQLLRDFLLRHQGIGGFAEPWKQRRSTGDVLDVDDELSEKPMKNQLCVHD